jgi:hypothetical protein
VTKGIAASIEAVGWIDETWSSYPLFREVSTKADQVQCPQNGLKLTIAQSRLARLCVEAKKKSGTLCFMRVSSSRSAVLLSGLLGLMSDRTSATERLSCECGLLPITVWPKADSRAAANTHVLIAFRRGWEPFLGNELSPPFRRLKFAIRPTQTTPTHSTQRAEARLSRRDVGGDQEGFVDLIPQSDLIPGKYEVIAIGPGAHEETLSTFSVGSPRDQAPPKWGGVRSTEYHRGSPGLTDCSSPEPFLVLHPEPPVDDVSDPKSVVFAMWIEGRSGKFDYQRVPDAYLLWIDGVLVVGPSLYCSPNHIPLPTKKQNFRFALRPMDLAGNLGAAHVVDAPLSLPH